MEPLSKCYVIPLPKGDVSVYDGLRSRPSEIEAQRHVEAQRRHNEPFHDNDEEEDDDPERFLFDNHDGSPALRTTSMLSPQTVPSSVASPIAHHSRPKWQEVRSTRRSEEDEDVPESLLLDPRNKSATRRASPSDPAADRRMRTEAQWRATQEQHALHVGAASRPSRRGSGRSRQTSRHHATARQPDPKAYATWLYTNVHNLDAFLLEIYEYYVEHGVWSILLSRTLSLATELFVFSFAMFLTTCIDYGKIPVSKSTKEVLIPRCMARATFLKKVALFFFIVYWLSRLAHYIRDTRRLFRLHDFFHHVLGIGDDDIQTVSWVRVVDGLVKVQGANVATANQAVSAKKYLDYREPQQRLSAESIANRLMRKANYYVALYNKDILDFTLPLPFVGSRQFYSKSLEWCIDFCLTNFIFDEQGSIRPFCLDVKNRSALVAALRMRLRFAAVISIVIAPVNILRFCIVYFFRYYTEFTRNPARASARSFTPFAEWKIREFNELDHLFQRRLRQSYPFANDYLKQFPKDKMDQLCRFVAFVSGAIAAVLTLATVFDSELFLGFEVTSGRTAFFWLTIMVGVFGVAHGSLPDENEVHDPVLRLREVLMFTHYMPAHWRDRLHSNEVRAEFSAMYQMKVLIFAEEILSLIVAPWILWRNSGKRSERIVDFFREQTVHVEGVGFQCNFAVFGFKKDPNAEDPSALLAVEPDGLRDDYYGLKDDKMAASVNNFMQYYSHYNRRYGSNRRTQGWQPPPSWPPLMPTPRIAEEDDPAPFPRPTAASTHRSALLNRPSSSLHVSSAHLPRRAARPPVANQQRPGDRSRSHTNPANHLHATVTESRLMAQDSDLREFADAPGVSGLESDTEVEEDGVGANGEGGSRDPNAAGAGVLGMLYQFSKAQTEKGGTGGGVGI